MAKSDVLRSRLLGSTRKFLGRSRSMLPARSMVGSLLVVSGWHGCTRLESSSACLRGVGAFPRGNFSTEGRGNPGIGIVSSVCIGRGSSGSGGKQAKVMCVVTWSCFPLGRPRSIESQHDSLLKMLSSSCVNAWPLAGAKRRMETAQKFNKHATIQI